MKNSLLIIIAIIPFLFSFTLNNNQNLAFEQNEVPVYIADTFCSNIGYTETELLDLITKANQQYWNRVSTSRLKLVNGGKLSMANAYHTDALCTSTSPSCTVNPNLAFNRGILISCNENSATNFPTPGLLAVTVPTSISGNKILGAVLLLNDTASSPLNGKSKDEITALIAHELGHAVGLGHSPVKDSLMYYLSIPTRRDLGWDDIDGITYLYPKEQPVSCGTISKINDDSNKMGHLYQMALAFILSILFFKFITNGPKGSKESSKANT